MLLFIFILKSCLRHEFIVTNSDQTLEITTGRPFTWFEKKSLT